MKQNRIFGTAPRTEILILLHALGRSTFTELAEALELPPSLVQKYLEEFAEDDVVCWQDTRGGKKAVTLNPEYVAAKQLSSLLDQLQRNSSVASEALLRSKKPK